MNPIQQFRHCHPIRVRTYQVDRQNVVHNIWYFYYFEEARVEFIRTLGLAVDADTFVGHTRFYVAHNACDYLSPALFDRELDILTRISRVGTSSITFEHLAVERDTGRALARGSHVLVHVSTETDRPERIPEAMRELIRAHEGGEVFAEA